MVQEHTGKGAVPGRAPIPGTDSTGSGMEQYVQRSDTGVWRREEIHARRNEGSLGESRRSAKICG